MSIRITTRKASTIEIPTNDDVITIDVMISCIDDTMQANMTISKQSQRGIATTYTINRDDIIDAIHIVTQQYYNNYFVPIVNAATDVKTKIIFSKCDLGMFNVTIDDNTTFKATHQQLIEIGRCFNYGCGANV